MWSGGEIKLRSPSHFSIDMFAVNVQYNNKKKPPNMSQERWDAMWKWWEKRQEEGLSLQDITKLDEDY